MGRSAAGGIQSAVCGVRALSQRHTYVLRATLIGVQGFVFKCIHRRQSTSHSTPPPLTQRLVYVREQVAYVVRRLEHGEHEQQRVSANCYTLDMQQACEARTEPQLRAQIARIRGVVDGTRSL